jgi:hypothetical protein
MTFAGHKKRNKVTAAVIVILVLTVSLASALYVTRKPSSPNSILPDLFDYNLGIYPTNGTVLQGCPSTTSVNVTIVQGSPEAVTLTASGGPNGTVCDFTNQTGTTASTGVFTSNLTISIPSSAPKGTYLVNVTSTAANGKNYTASYALSVVNAEILVSGTISLSFSPYIVPGKIEFVNAQLNYIAYVHFDLTDYHGLIQHGTYSISLPNNQTYSVICTYGDFSGMGPGFVPTRYGTIGLGTLIINGGVGDTSITNNYTD